MAANLTIGERRIPLQSSNFRHLMKTFVIAGRGSLLEVTKMEAKSVIPHLFETFQTDLRKKGYRECKTSLDSAEFLRLFDIWWKVSNSKNQFSTHRLGHAATKGDQKPEFLRAMANWIEKWTNERLPKSQKFTLSAQTSAALVRTLRCHAQLIEDLLEDGYLFVLTAQFQSDPLERRFCQMSGGRFLV